MNGADLRKLAREVLIDRGFEVRIESGQGFLPGSRLTIVKGRDENAVAVKASQTRAVSFTRQASGRWRTLHAMDWVVAVVPGTTSADTVDVYAFKKAAVVKAFNKAWDVMESAGRPMGYNVPVFIPLDRRSLKNVGHNVGDLKRRAEWDDHVTEKQVSEFLSRKDENYIQQFRRRFAAENGVDVDEVTISITPKSL